MQSKPVNLFDFILRSLFTLGLFFGLSVLSKAQPVAPLLTYFDDPSQRSFAQDIFMLQKPGHPFDSTYLIAGGSRDLSFLNNYQIRNRNFIQLPTTARNGSVLLSADSMTAYILHLNKTLDTVLNVIHFPPGTAMTVSRIRSTVRTGDPTGELYISGMRAVPDSGRAVQGLVEGNVSFPKFEYYIARLDNNFFNGLPSECLFFVNARCKYDYRTTNLPASMQPWDVNNKGEVIYGEGATYIPVYNSFSWLRKVDAGGNPMVVKGWLMHVMPNGQVKYGAGNDTGASYSIINGMMGRRGSLRSHSLADWNYQGQDANGNPRPGKYPDDFFYRTWVNPVTGDGEPKPISQVDTVTVHRDFASGYEAGPGRTGRYPDEPRTYGWSAVVCDKVNNDFYVGYIMGYAWGAPANMTLNTAWQTQHEWDPTIMKFDKDGYLQAWDRCKPESGVDQPDHYQDLLDIDYTNKRLVVLCRQHGDGQFTSWRGHQLRFNPGQFPFKATLNGTTGNVHVSWIGSYSLDSMRIKNATFLAENMSNMPAAQPYTDPHYDGHQNQNQGWWTMNTTRLAGSGSLKALNGFKVSRSGLISVVFQGQRVMTTADAHLKMPKTNDLANAGWPAAVRVYTPALDTVIYSSLLAAQTPTANGFIGATPMAVLPLRDRVLTAGNFLHSTLQMPLVRPAGMAWGHDIQPSGAGTGYLSRFGFTRFRLYPEINDTITYPVITKQATPTLRPQLSAVVYPNPVSTHLFINLDGQVLADRLALYNAKGQLVWERKNNTDYAYTIDVSKMAKGVYNLQVWEGKQSLNRRIVIQ